MIRTRKKYMVALPAKFILPFVLTLLILLGYSTVLEAAEKNTNELGKIDVFDPFMLTSVLTNSIPGAEGEPWNPRALMMIPYRGPKRSPIKPPWPPE